MRTRYGLSPLDDSQDTLLNQLAAQAIAAGLRPDAGGGRQQEQVGGTHAINRRHERYRDAAAHLSYVVQLLHHLDQPQNRADDSHGGRVSAGVLEDACVAFGALFLAPDAEPPVGRVFRRRPLRRPPATALCEERDPPSAPPGLPWRPRRRGAPERRSAWGWQWWPGSRARSRRAGSGSGGRRSEDWPAGYWRPPRRRFRRRRSEGPSTAPNRRFALFRATGRRGFRRAR